MRKGSECDGKERRLRHKNRIVLEEACLGIEVFFDREKLRGGFRRQGMLGRLRS